VRLAIRDYRGAGVPVVVISSSPQFESVEYVVGFNRNVDQRRAIQQLKTLTVGAMSVLAPNEPLQTSMLLALARAVPGIVVQQGAIQVPLGDVFPDNGRTIRTTFDRVTVNGL
jgi:hypothetical protein